MRFEGETQTILADPVLRAQGIYGNCLQAAVASLLSRPLDAVPHFGAFVYFDEAIELWCRGEGLQVRKVEPIAEIPRQPCILGGVSPRGVQHVVCAEDGEISWDPHPSRGGLVSFSRAWFITPVDGPGGSDD